MSQPFNIAMELIYERYPVKWVLGRARPLSWRPSDSSNSLGMTVTSPVEYAGTVRFLGWGEMPRELKRELLTGSKRLSRESRLLEFEIVIGHVQRAWDESTTRVDPWLLRNTFIELKKKNSDLVAFLNKCGPWSEEISLGSRVYSEPKIAIFLPGQFWRDRAKIKQAIENGTAWERTYSPDFPLWRRSEFPHLILEEKYALNAMLQSVTLDHLREVKFRLCAREDCRIPFAVESNHRRLYHSQACAHLANIRRQREDERSGLSSARKTKTRK